MDPGATPEQGASAFMKWLPPVGGQGRVKHLSTKVSATAFSPAIDCRSNRRPRFLSLYFAHLNLKRCRTRFEEPV
jgi:hypothetical protein